jgi:hypothetical protein
LGKVFIGEKMKKELEKTREYIDYLNNHYDNVQKAWKLIKERCIDFDVLQNQIALKTLDRLIEDHDKSKLSHEEFVPYRKQFFPVNEGEKENSGFDEAWEHHRLHNDHHWEHWCSKDFSAKPSIHSKICLLHNISDWVGMSMKFGDTAQSFYEKNKEKIHMPEWAIKYMYKVFKRIYR